MGGETAAGGIGPKTHWQGVIMKPNPDLFVKTAAGVLAAAVAAAAGAAAKTPQTSEFEELGIIVEQNATDGDTEVVISGVAGDDGLRLITVYAPGGRKVLSLVASAGQTTTLHPVHQSVIAPGN